jgi:hypothetical protein
LEPGTVTFIFKVVDLSKLVEWSLSVTLTTGAAEMPRT